MLKSYHRCKPLSKRGCRFERRPLRPVRPASPQAKAHFRVRERSYRFATQTPHHIDEASNTAAPHISALLGAGFSLRLFDCFPGATPSACIRCAPRILAQPRSTLALRANALANLNAGGKAVASLPHSKISGAGASGRFSRRRCRLRPRADHFPVGEVAADDEPAAFERAA
jgi:hypothetical protein